jgi:hypothetical protein
MIEIPNFVTVGNYSAFGITLFSVQIGGRYTDDADEKSDWEWTVDSQDIDVAVTEGEGGSTITYAQ